MAKVRSPNYPSVPLGIALEAIRTALQKEGRNKMSRSVLAKHLGYTSLNGRALAKIGAVRAYGMVDGSGDELRISEDAVHGLKAPSNSVERKNALQRMAMRPSLFAEIVKQFPETLPSEENLHYFLATKNFTDRAAEKAAKSYLSTMRLVHGIPDDYNPPDDEIEDGGESDEVGTPLQARNVPPPVTPTPKGQVKLMDGERIAFTEEGGPGQYLKLIASGDVDDTMLEALEDFVKRQRKRLKASAARADTCPHCGADDMAFKRAIEVNEKTGDEFITRECGKCGADVSRTQTQ